MQLLKPMQNNKRSRSGSEAKREPFPTIDDALQKAEALSADLRRISEFKYPLDIRRGVNTRKGVKKSMADKDKADKNERESSQLKGAGRTYFLDVEKTREGKAYLRITESRKGEGDSFERNSIHVFPEDAKAFRQAVNKMIKKLG